MDDLHARVEPLERAVTDGEGDLAALADGAATADRVESLEAELESLREDVAELTAATKALRGYVGNVRSVNESVVERAEAAFAATEAIEERLDAMETGVPTGAGESPSGATAIDRADGGDTEPRRSIHCRACGQPAPNNRRNDDSNGGSDTGQRDTAVEPDVGGVAGTTAEPLEGFDPAEPGDRVTIAPADRRAEPTSERTGSPAQDDGLVGRVRELL